jgi:hypothetical protein
MEPREEWRGHYERMRAEASDFAKRAANFRRDAQELRRRRDWLGALKADSAAADFRRWRDNRKAEAVKIKSQWGFR